MRARYGLVWLLSMSACAAPMRITRPYCAPPAGEAARALEAGPSLPLGSSREQHMGSLIGLTAALEERHAGALTAATRMDVLTRIELARLELNAITAELDCEGERTQQAADYLSSRQASTVQTVTVASILTATAVGVTSVLLSTRNASAPVQDGVGISGAAAAAALGFATLYVSPTVHFEHGRNMLRDIWQGPEHSTVYSPIVWGYLTRAEFSNAQDAPIREKLMARFCTFVPKCQDATTQRLVFGDGGEFDVDTLRLQASLLDQVKAEVDLEHQELQLLADALLN